MPRRRSLLSVYTRKIYLCKKTGVKEGGERLLEVVYFWELTVNAFVTGGDVVTLPEGGQQRLGMGPSLQSPIRHCKNGWY